MTWGPNSAHRSCGLMRWLVVRGTILPPAGSKLSHDILCGEPTGSPFGARLLRATFNRPILGVGGPRVAALVPLLPTFHSENHYHHVP